MRGVRQEVRTLVGFQWPAAAPRY